MPLAQRKAYMAALDQASSNRRIQPLATFFAELVREQAHTPLPRPGGG